MIETLIIVVGWYEERELVDYKCYVHMWVEGYVERFCRMIYHLSFLFDLYSIIICRFDYKYYLENNSIRRS